MKKWLGIVVIVLIVVAGLFFYGRYYWVFGYGYKAGTLNYIVLKGYVFKTYEGEVILAGFKNQAPNSMMSNEFSFSIVDPKVAHQLELASGKEVQLHYREYFGAVPWRGYSKFIVDSVVSIGPVRP
jgi:hypothetical protein